MPTALDLAAAIAEQDRQMIAVMRRDWDETGALPVHTAHARHRQIAAEHGFAGATDTTLRERMGAVVERARRPGG